MIGSEVHPKVTIHGFKSLPSGTWGTVIGNAKSKGQKLVRIEGKGIAEISKCYLKEALERQLDYAACIGHTVYFHGYYTGVCFEKTGAIVDWHQGTNFFLVRCPNEASYYSLQPHEIHFALRAPVPPEGQQPILPQGKPDLLEAAADAKAGAHTKGTQIDATDRFFHLLKATVNARREAHSGTQVAVCTGDATIRRGKVLAWYGRMGKYAVLLHGDKTPVLTEPWATKRYGGAEQEGEARRVHDRDSGNMGTCDNDSPHDPKVRKAASPFGTDTCVLQAAILLRAFQDDTGGLRTSIENVAYSMFDPHRKGPGVIINVAFNHEMAEYFQNMSHTVDMRERQQWGFKGHIGMAMLGQCNEGYISTGSGKDRNHAAAFVLETNVREAFHMEVGIGEKGELQVVAKLWNGAHPPRIDPEEVYAGQEEASTNDPTESTAVSGAMQVETGGDEEPSEEGGKGQEEQSEAGKPWEDKEREEAEMTDQTMPTT